MKKIIIQFPFLLIGAYHAVYSQTNPVIGIFPQGTVLHGNITYHNDALPKHLLDIYLPGKHYAVSCRW